jgi:hypothetical protein
MLLGVIPHGPQDRGYIVCNHAPRHALLKAMGPSLEIRNSDFEFVAPSAQTPTAPPSCECSREVPGDGIVSGFYRS